MKITSVRAVWLHCPIPYDQQHVSDFGRIASFDCVLTTVETDAGITGYGEAKAAVGSAGTCSALVTAIEQDLAPLIIGRDPRRISEIWEVLYNGPRDHYALSRGRAFPVLGRRGLTISAISGIDLALWDILGKTLQTPVCQLVGGAHADQMQCYASGGWAGIGKIGEQTKSYVDRGFEGVKMRVGVMDNDVATSVVRVREARAALGPKIKLMADAHGTMSVPEAKQFCRGIDEYGLYWFEEPCNSDSIEGTAEVRAMSSTPIACGESEFTRFDFRDMIATRSCDVLQPDMAICGGFSEGLKVAALAAAHQLELAPHCWGSALSFAAGVSLAFASSSAVVIEYSLGANPLLREMPVDPPVVIDGKVSAPTAPGWGIQPRAEFIEEFGRKV
jgi:D-galactarolactone cycloisomerase